MPTFRTERGKPFQQLESISPALWATRSRRRNRVNDRMLHSNVYRCATSMAVHLEMTQSQTAEEFQRKLNAFIARRTRPQLIISDNTTVFKLDPKDTKEWTAARPPSQARNKVAVQPVQISMVGRYVWKTYQGCKEDSLQDPGETSLTFEQLEAVVIDIEKHLNNRLGSEGGEEQVLRSNIVMWGQNSHML